MKDLDPLLHSQLRLAIMSILMAQDEAEFTFLKEKTSSTAGNLSIQLKKLEDAGYLKIKKGYKGNYPHTMCYLQVKGRKAFENYVEDLKSYFKFK